MEIHHIHQSDTHTRTLSLLRMILQTPQQMELHLVHQSGTHTQTHTLSLSLSRSLILKIIQTSRQMEIHHVYQSGTHSYTLFNTHDNTDATGDGDKPYSSVRYTHTHTLSLILRIIQTPRQMEIHHVHQSGTHINTLSSILKIIQTPRQMEITLFISQVDTHTLSSILMIIQTPRQMEINHIHQSGTHTHIHTPFKPHDKNRRHGKWR